MKLLLALATGCVLPLVGCSDSDDSQEEEVVKECAMVKIEAYSAMPDYVLSELSRDFSNYRIKITGDNFVIDTVLGKIADGIQLPVGLYSFELEYNYKDTVQAQDDRDVFDNKVMHSHLRYQGAYKEKQRCHMVKSEGPNLFRFGITIMPRIVEWCDKPIDKCDYGKASDL